MQVKRKTTVLALSLLLIAPLLSAVIANSAAQQLQPIPLPESTAQPEPTEIVTSLGPLPENLLPPDQLLEYTLLAAQAFGVVEGELQVDDLDVSQGMYTTYEKWVEFDGGRLGQAMYDWGLAQRPVFVMPITGLNGLVLNQAGTVPLNYSPEQALAKARATDKMVVVIYAEDWQGGGDPVYSINIINTQTFPDFSNLPQYDKPSASQ
jgi:hypothetical protein